VSIFGLNLDVPLSLLFLAGQPFTSMIMDWVIRACRTDKREPRADATKPGALVQQSGTTPIT
jgi:hypothetical protein